MYLAVDIIKDRKWFPPSQSIYTNDVRPRVETIESDFLVLRAQQEPCPNDSMWALLT